MRIDESSAWTQWKSNSLIEFERNSYEDDDEDYIYRDVYEYHPLNKGDLDLGNLVDMLRCDQTPVTLKFKPDDSLDDECCNVNGIALNWEINLDNGQFSLLVGNNVFSHRYTWPMKSFYHFKSLSRWGYFSQEFVNETISKFLEERLNWHDKLQPYTTKVANHGHNMYSHCAAITIQAQIRRYLVWRSGFEPGTGRLYKKAKRSFDATVAVAISKY